MSVGRWATAGIVAGHCFAGLGFASGQASAAEPAKLVVLVIVDQLSTTQVARYRPLLTGGLGRMIKNGAYYPEGRFAYANTETGAGHATVATGTWPNVHGIVGNQWVDRTTGARVTCVEDPKFGNSPQHLRAPGIADAIKLATRGRGKVVSLATKARASVLVGGHRPELVVWYDASEGRFTPGQWPGMAPVPKWFAPVVLSTGPERVTGQWTRLRPDIDYAAWASEDDRPFEEALPGLGRTFPHQMGAVPKEWPHVYRGTPAALDDLMKLAEAAIIGEDLGGDEFVDLLVLGVSSFDYVGHWFGPNSQESLDMLLRIDAALAKLQDRLFRKVGRDRLLMVLTGDHGVLPVPEAAAAYGVNARRIAKSVIDEALDGRLRVVIPPRLYLDSSERAGPAARTLADRRRWAKKLAQRPEILEAYVPEDVDRFTEPFETYYRRTLYPGRMPDILFRHAAFSYISSVGPNGMGRGTGHGSPYLYDQTVPVLLMGTGVRSGTHRRPVLMTRIAPSIAAALEILPPAAASAPALPGVLP